MGGNWKVIEKMLKLKNKMIMITPVYMKKEWLKVLMKVCYATPTFLTHSKDLFLKKGTEEVGKPP